MSEQESCPRCGDGRVVALDPDPDDPFEGCVTFLLDPDRACLACGYGWEERRLAG